jgi:hypothetical protein
MSEQAYRWVCPLTSCGGEKSPLYGDREQVETEFSTHLRKHSIETATDYIKSVAPWLGAFTLLAED